MAVILMLTGMLLVLLAATAVAWGMRRRPPAAPSRMAREADLPTRDPPMTPTPVARIVAPSFEDDPDEARTEVMGNQHLQAFFDDEATQTTEVKADVLGELTLEESEETTSIDALRQN